MLLRDVSKPLPFKQILFFHATSWFRYAASRLLNQRSTLRIQRLIQIPENIFNILQTDGQTNEIGTDARGFLLLLRKLGVRCAGGVKRKGFRVAKICNVTE